MSLSNIISDVAAVILRGEILQAGTDSDDAKQFGVVHTLRALDVFDATADGWCGRDGIPHRWTEEEAEKFARGMSGSSHDGTAYAAMRIPTRPIRATVGPFAVAGQEPGSRFACIDWTSGPGLVVEVAHAVPYIDPSLGPDHLYEDDYSAFGAALAFVRLVGERAAYGAIAAKEMAQ